jgi:predicted CoA-binding protein
METVAVLGASPKPERYSHKAVQLLKTHNYRVIPVNPAGKDVDEETSVKSLGEIQEPLDTITVYVNPRRGEGLIDEIVAAHPRRVILNPGTESEEMEKILQNNDIEVIRACTLVLLNTGQF